MFNLIFGSVAWIYSKNKACLCLLQECCVRKCLEILLPPVMAGEPFCLWALSLLGNGEKAEGMPKWTPPVLCHLRQFPQFISQQRHLDFVHNYFSPFITSLLERSSSAVYMMGNQSTCRNTPEAFTIFENLHATLIL